MNINQNLYNSPKGSPSPTHHKFNAKSNQNSSKKQTFNRKSKSIIIIIFNGNFLRFNTFNKKTLAHFKILKSYS